MLFLDMYFYTGDTMRKAFFVLFLGILGLSWAQKPTIAIYPFDSQDILLGIAISELVSEALETDSELFEVILSPVESPTLIPPLVVEDGYINPLLILDSDETIGEIESYDGVSIVRDVLGVDVALAGEISYLEQGISLNLFIATNKGSRNYILTTTEDTPEALVDAILARLNSHLKLGKNFTGSEPLLLDGDYGEYIRGLALLSAGFVLEARGILEALLESENVNTILASKIKNLLQNIDLVFEGQVGQDVVLSAALALVAPELSDQDVINIFNNMYGNLGMPLAQVWLGALKDDVNDRAGANEAFDLAASYPYGLAARANYRAAHGFSGAREDVLEISDSKSKGVLLAGIIAAQSFEDTKLEKDLAIRLTQVAPYLAYPLEILSFIAFNEDDPVAAAEALVVATKLFPENSLYWTNLGWAYYLLNFLERSEIASKRAVKLNPEEEVAWFNLGLAQIVVGRIDEAMDSYAEGLKVDPEVNDEAIVDLENALELYPYAVDIHFALGTLYEAEGRLEEASNQFKRYQKRSLYARSNDDFVHKAEQRYNALTAPPAPIGLSEVINLTLGRNGLEVTSYSPGDRLYPSFEIFTEGIELPKELSISLALKFDAEEIVALPAQQVNIPQNTVGILIDNIPLELPITLEAGNYQLNIEVWANEDNKTQAFTSLEVVGEASYLRQLVSRDVIMRTLNDNSPLYGNSTLASQKSDSLLINTLIQELRQNAEAAEEALLTIDTGRFKGLSGGELFSQSTESDIHDFLNFLLVSGISDVEFSFVDGYAQWALDGAQSP